MAQDIYWIKRAKFIQSLKDRLEMRDKEEAHKNDT